MWVWIPAPTLKPGSATSLCNTSTGWGGGGEETGGTLGLTHQPACQVGEFQVQWETVSKYKVLTSGLCKYAHTYTCRHAPTQSHTHETYNLQRGMAKREKVAFCSRTGEHCSVVGSILPVCAKLKKVAPPDDWSVWTNHIRSGCVTECACVSLWSNLCFHWLNCQSHPTLLSRFPNTSQKVPPGRLWI